MANLETLELTINGSSKSASEGIDQLVHSLSSLSRAVGRSVSGLMRLNAQLKELKGYGKIKLLDVDKAKSVNGIKKAAKDIKEAKEALYDVENNNGRGSYNPPKIDPVKEAEYNQKMAEAVQRNKEQLAYRRYMNNFYRERDRLKKAGLFKEEGQEQNVKDLKQQTAEVTQATNAYKDSVDKTKYSVSNLKDKTEEMKNATVNGTKEMKKSIESVKHSSRGLLSQIGRIAKTMMIRTAIRTLMKAAKEGLDNFYQYSKAIGNTYAGSMDKLTSKWTQFKNQLGAAVGTALSAFLPILTAIANAATWALNAVTALFALLTGKSTYSKAVEGTNEYASAAGGAAKANKELLASFDELNVIQNETSGGGGGGGTNYSKLFEETDLPQWMKEWKPIIEAILGGVLGAVILPKIWDWIKKILGLFGAGAGKTLLDTINKLTGGNTKLPDISGNVAQMGLYAIATNATSTAIDALKTKVLALKSALEGLSLISTILNTLIAMIGSLAGGTIKLKIDRTEFDKLKEDFDKYIKEHQDLSIGVYFDPATTYVFSMARKAIDQWLDTKGVKLIDIMVEDTLDIKMVNEWINTKDVKLIDVKVNNETDTNNGNGTGNDNIFNKKFWDVSFNDISNYVKTHSAKQVVDDFITAFRDNFILTSKKPDDGYIGAAFAHKVASDMDANKYLIIEEANNWRRRVKKVLTDEKYVLGVDINKFTVSNVVNYVKNTIESVTATVSKVSVNGEGIKSDVKTAVESTKPTVNVGATVPDGTKTEVKNSIESIQPTITAEVKAKDLDSFAKKVKEALTSTIQLKMQESANIVATVAMVARAKGGLVDSGDLFLANENGKSEMIGRFGSHAAVANQEQMVEAMARGVQYANEEQNALLRRQNELLLGILQKDSSVRLSASSALGRVARQSLDMYSMATGV